MKNMCCCQHTVIYSAFIHEVEVIQYECGLRVVTLCNVENVVYL